jgi:hypothetical protein
VVSCSFFFLQATKMIVFALIELARATPKPPAFFFDMIRVPLLNFSAVWTWITHSIPPAKLNAVQNTLNASDGFVRGHLLPWCSCESVDALHGLNETVQASHFSLDDHLTIRIDLFNGVSDFFRCRFALDVLQFCPSFVAYPGRMLSPHASTDIVGRL